MTKQEFDNYQFSINTKVKVYSVWDEIYSVDFEKRMIEIQDGSMVHYCEILEIREI